jgi:hypothetical protein
MHMHHDMGGQLAGPIERSEHVCAPWEKLIDAVFTLLSTQHSELFRVDELRRNIEALAPDVYDQLSYYERWVAAITNTMLQRGVFTSEELGRKMEEVRARVSSHEET